MCLKYNALLALRPTSRALWDILLMVHYTLSHWQGLPFLCCKALSGRGGTQKRSNGIKGLHYSEMKGILGQLQTLFVFFFSVFLQKPNKPPLLSSYDVYSELRKGSLSSPAHLILEASRYCHWRYDENTQYMVSFHFLFYIGIILVSPS